MWVFMVPNPSGPGLVMFFPSWRLSGLGDFVYWATSLFREAQAPALVRARVPHAERPGEAQRGREKAQRAQRAYRTKAKY